MPKISGSNLAEHREQLRRHVFDAFAALSAERSFDAITMAGLAERAGIGRTTIYHHFRDKEAVLIAFAGHETERYLAALDRALAVTDDPAERLRIYIRHQLGAGEEFHLGMGPALSGSLSDRAREQIRAHVVAVEDTLRELLVAGVQADVFVVDDLPSTMSLIHACLSPRHLPGPAIEAFVLRALGAD